MNEANTAAVATAALKRIQRNGKREIQDWITVGNALVLGFHSVGGDKDHFYKWLQANFVDLSVGSAASTVSAAMWLATVEFDNADIQFYGTSGVSHPVALQADRKRVKNWVDARMREDEAKAQTSVKPIQMNALPKPI